MIFIFQIQLFIVGDVLTAYGPSSLLPTLHFARAHAVNWTALSGEVDLQIWP